MLLLTVSAGNKGIEDIREAAPTGPKPGEFYRVGIGNNAPSKISAQENRVVSLHHLEVGRSSLM